MRLKDVEKDEQGTVYRFAYIVADDFVRNAVIIRTNPSDCILSMRLISADGGIAVWEDGRGLTHCNAWEDEEQVASISWLSKHYQTSLPGKARDGQYAAGILRDCLDVCGDRYLRDRMLEFCGDGRARIFIARNLGHESIPVREPEFRPPSFTLPKKPPPNRDAAEAIKNQSEDDASPLSGEPEIEFEPETFEERRRRAMRMAWAGLAAAGLVIALIWLYFISLYFRG